MNMGSTRVAIATVLVATVAIVSNGCGGQAQLRKGEVETQAKRALGHVVGRPPEAVDCPGDMPAKVGETMRCVLRDGGSRYGVTVTITSVDSASENAQFDVVVDKKALPAA